MSTPSPIKKATCLQLFRVTDQMPSARRQSRRKHVKSATGRVSRAVVFRVGIYAAGTAAERRAIMRKFDGYAAADAAQIRAALDVA